MLAHGLHRADDEAERFKCFCTDGLLHVDRAGIAERLRGLIGGQNEGDLGAIARRLGVDELSLRLSVDDLSP